MKNFASIWDQLTSKEKEAFISFWNLTRIETDRPQMTMAELPFVSTSEIEHFLTQLSFLTLKNEKFALQTRFEAMGFKPKRNRS